MVPAEPAPEPPSERTSAGPAIRGRRGPSATPVTGRAARAGARWRGLRDWAPPARRRRPGTRPLPASRGRVERLGWRCPTSGRIQRGPGSTGSGGLGRSERRAGDRGNGRAHDRGRGARTGDGGGLDLPCRPVGRLAGETAREVHRRTAQRTSPRETAPEAGSCPEAALAAGTTGQAARPGQGSRQAAGGPRGRGAASRRVAALRAGDGEARSELPTRGPEGPGRRPLGRPCRRGGDRSRRRVGERRGRRRRRERAQRRRAGVDGAGARPRARRLARFCERRHGAVERPPRQAATPPRRGAAGAPARPPSPSCSRASSPARRWRSTHRRAPPPTARRWRARCTGPRAPIADSPPPPPVARAAGTAAPSVGSGGPRTRCAAPSPG